MAERADAAALGLRAVIRIALARRPARVVHGVAVPFDEIDPARVDRRLLADGIADATAARCADPTSPAAIEAAIAVLYATAPDPARPDWTAIRTAHRALRRLDPSPARDLAATIADALAGDVDAIARLGRFATGEPAYVRRDAALALADLAWRAGDRDAAAARYRALVDTADADGWDPAIRALLSSRGTLRKARVHPGRTSDRRAPRR